MSNNYDTYGYENNNYQSKPSLIKRLIIISLIILAIILVIILIKKCSNPNVNINKPTSQVVKYDYEIHLIEAGKKYFEYNYDKYPKEIGDCEEIELQGLIDRNLVNESNFSKCNTNKTYVRVCMLENRTYHYSPWLVCGDKSSADEYGIEREGNLSDIKVDSTIVDFKFIPQKLVVGEKIYGPVEEIWKDEIKYNSYKTISSTNYYRYKDELFIWEIKNRKYYTRDGDKTKSSDVNEYYLTSPNSNYNLKDSAATGYKWFTTSSQKIYATDSKGNKVVSDRMIDGYPISEIVSCKSYQTRTLTGSSNPYHYYKCGKSKNSTSYIYQYEKECGSAPNTSYSYEMDNLYTCGYANAEEIENKRVTSASDKCNSYSEWKYITGSCDITKDTCRKVDPYCTYNWYKIEKDAIRKYYPSGYGTAQNENTYFTTAPINGAIRDDSTKANVYKWYSETSYQTSEYTALAPTNKENAVKTNISKWTAWSDYSVKNPKTNDGRNRKIESREKIKLKEIKGTTQDSYIDLSEYYLTKDELILLLKNKGYAIDSLPDITSNGELKLKIQMLVRNKKESN